MEYIHSATIYDSDHILPTLFPIHFIFKAAYIVSHNEWTFWQSLQFFMMSLKWIVSFEVLLEMVLLYLFFFLLFFSVAFSFSAVSFLLLNSVGATPLKARLMESADGKLYDKELNFFF